MSVVSLIPIINLLAALMLLINFAMLMQRQLLTLTNLIIAQGIILSFNMVLVGAVQQHPQLYWSALLTLILKAGLIPYIFRRLLVHFNLRTKMEQLSHVPMVLFIGIILVIFAFHLSVPLTSLTIHGNSGTIAIALASVLLATWMIVVKRKALSQVIGLLALENSLFFAAVSTTYGMPLIIELGIAFDILIGVLIFGIFFFHIRETFDSFHISHLEKLREE